MSSPSPPAPLSSSTVCNLYFERQKRMHCLKHSLNNLLQRHAFSAADLNDIAVNITSAEGGGFLRSLTHRWPVLGNFDDDVLRAAAALCGVELVWAMTERAGELPSILGDGNDLMNQPHVMGIIVNKRNQGLIAGFTGARHWFTILKLDGTWYNVDSMLPSPHRFPDPQLTSVRACLFDLIARDGAQVFVATRAA